MHKPCNGGRCPPYFWAYTSEIIREKTAHPGVLETLSALEAEGYRKADVQPLHIFPGTEYSVLSDMCHAFPGMRVVMGETLLHRWGFVKETLAIVSKDFLPPKDGYNIVSRIKRVLELLRFY